MSGGRYLARLAARATRSLATVRPARRWGRVSTELADPIAQPEALRPVTSPFAPAAPAPLPAQTRDSVAPSIVMPPSEQRHPQPADEPTPALARPSSLEVTNVEPRRDPLPPAMDEKPAPLSAPPRPPADFVFAAPRRRFQPEGRDARPLAAPPAQTRDPIAALAAAVRWTSSDQEAERDPFERPHEPTPESPPLRPATKEAVPVPLVSRPSPPPAQPEVRTSPAPITEPVPPTADAPERFTTIHIGTVQVEVVPPAQPPVPATTAPASPAPATSLARGLASTIGFRQS